MGFDKGFFSTGGKPRSKTRQPPLDPERSVFMEMKGKGDRNVSPFWSRKIGDAVSVGDQA